MSARWRFIYQVWLPDTRFFLLLCRCTWSFKFPYHSCWLVDQDWLPNHFENEHVARWMEKLCTYVILHIEAQIFNDRSQKKNFVVGVFYSPFTTTMFSPDPMLFNTWLMMLLRHQQGWVVNCIGTILIDSGLSILTHVHFTLETDLWSNNISHSAPDM